MNEYFRECLLGGWHLLKQEPTPRPKEVVREKPVWASKGYDYIRPADSAHSACTFVVYQVEGDHYTARPKQIKAAAQGPELSAQAGETDRLIGVSQAPVAAAPIDGFRVGDVVLGDEP